MMGDMNSKFLKNLKSEKVIIKESSDAVLDKKMDKWNKKIKSHEEDIWGETEGNLLVWV